MISARRATCLLALAAVAAAPAAAHADQPEASGTESEIVASESRTLGAGHAQGHAQQRAQAREDEAALAAMSPAERRALARADQRAERVDGPPSELGQWTSGPAPAETFGINTVLMPTGKLLIWSYELGAGSGGAEKLDIGDAWVHDPETGAWKEVDPPGGVASGYDWPKLPIFCSGGSLLPDGQVLVAGGSLDWPSGETGWYGLNAVLTFDPLSETWTRQPAMTKGRWYPSQLLLGDGTTLIAGGYDEGGWTAPLGDGPAVAPFDQLTDTVDRFLPPASPGGQGSNQRLPDFALGAPNHMGLYPQFFQLRDGRIFLSGPDSRPAIAGPASASPASFAWSPIGDELTDNFGGNTAVLRPAGPDGSTSVTVMGGFAAPPPFGIGGASKFIQTMDLSNPSPAWTPGPQFNVPRVWHNTVTLPDGSMVTVGGGAERAEPGLDPQAKQVELFDPASQTWTLGPAQVEDRGYHSTAVLLPDGRVLSTGDDRNPAPEGDKTDTTEIYSPPYLFKGGARPGIDSVQSAIAWNTPFSFTASGDPQRAVLVAPGAVTHSTDMHQRHVELQIARRSGSRVTAVAPPTPEVAPPGWYMLFVLDSRGVPSEASWVRVSDTASAAADPVPAGPADPVPAAPADPVPAGPAGPVAPGPTGPVPPGSNPPGNEPTKPKSRLRVTIKGRSLRTLKRTGRLNLAIAAPRRGELRLTLSPRWLAKTRQLRFARAQTRQVTIGLSRTSRRKLANRRTLRITAQVTWRDKTNAPSPGKHQVTFRR